MGESAPSRLELATWEVPKSASPSMGDWGISPVAYMLHPPPGDYKSFRVSSLSVRRTTRSEPGRQGTSKSSISRTISEPFLTSFRIELADPPGALARARHKLAK
jgi:hypothetical protein